LLATNEDEWLSSHCAVGQLGTGTEHDGGNGG
jgi:hypothetical protein